MDELYALIIFRELDLELVPLGHLLVAHRDGAVDALVVTIDVDRPGIVGLDRPGLRIDRRDREAHRHPGLHGLMLEGDVEDHIRHDGARRRPGGRASSRRGDQSARADLGRILRYDHVRNLRHAVCVRCRGQGLLPK